ncbi:MAG: hypothetical protein CBC23_006970 [Rhodospirillaceae bacterium TMED63]|nr:MAG: hypothetical protein CBC23_006970 [Rhodospirillaceae bacterium TMED63]
MNFDMPKAVFCGLALIAAAIYFGPGSVPATAQGGIQKIALCDEKGIWCADVEGGWIHVKR